MSDNKPLTSGISAGTQQCPACHMTNVRSFPTMYEIGKSYAQSRLGRVAVTGGAGFSLGNSHVRSTPESQLAAKADPPERPRISWSIILLTVISFFFAAFFLTIAGTASIWVAAVIGLAGWPLGYYFQRGSYRKQLAEYDQEYKVWRQKWLCLQCGEVFLPGPGTSAK